jgi:hypothetical protein
MDTQVSQPNLGGVNNMAHGRNRTRSAGIESGPLLDDDLWGHSPLWIGEFLVADDLVRKHGPTSFYAFPATLSRLHREIL